MSEIKINVSIGEALDKLTILDIKLFKIKDDRVNDVKIEYNYLYTELKNYVEEFKYHYDFLKKVNLDIWELQDEVRAEQSNFISKCEDILFLNDARFTIKNKINNLAKSKFKEQKGYPKRKVCIITGDLTSEMLDKVLYVSVFYDEVYVNTSSSNTSELSSKDSTIIFTSEIQIDGMDIINYTNIGPVNNITHPYLKKTLKF